MLLKFVQFGEFGERIRRRLPFLSSDLDNFGDPAGLGMCRLSPCIRHFTLLWEGLPLSDSLSSLGRQQAPGEALRSRFVRVRRCFIEADHTDQLPTQGLSVPHLIDEQKEHPPPPGAVVAFFVTLAPDTKLTTYLLTYQVHVT